jgi:replicative DNA helicase
MRPRISVVSDLPQVADPYSNEAEKAVIVACLSRPEAISEVAGKLVHEDFDGSLHRRIADVLLGLHGEGRKPSIESICAAVGDSEVAPDLTMRDYLRSIIEQGMYRLHLPLADAIETVLDASRRRKLAEVGSILTLGSATGFKSINDLAHEAMAGLNDLLTLLRAGKRNSYTAEDAGQAALDALASGKKLDYPTTGLTDLDRMLGGWPRGQLSVVAGRPGMGKSLFAVDAVAKAARAGNPVLFFSLEMLKEQIGPRLLTDLAFTGSDPIAYEDIIQMRLTEERQIGRLQKAQTLLDGLPLQIEEERGLTVADIIARSEKHANKLAKENKKLDLVVVDHIGLVRASDRYKGVRHRELAEISDGLATLAKDLSVAVVALCQLNRGVEGRDNKRPSMADLRESGAIEEDASAIIFLYRAAYYLGKARYDEAEAENARLAELDRCKNLIELAVDKNRNGRVGIIDAFVEVSANALRNGSFAR